MSGGSYNYLYAKSVETLIEDDGYDGIILQMANDLDENKASIDTQPVVDATRQVVSELEEYREKLNALQEQYLKSIGSKLDKLHEVWESQEMMASGDWNRGNLLVCIQEFNDGKIEKA